MTLVGNTPSEEKPRLHLSQECHLAEVLQKSAATRCRMILRLLRHVGGTNKVSVKDANFKMRSGVEDPGGTYR